MISTINHKLLPDITSLEQTCKAISVLDAILSPEWQYRYYSYNSKWDVNEECLQMRDGSGDEMHILFKENNCVINGFSHEYDQGEKANLTKGLPKLFNEFIFEEPIKSIGTTFCVCTENSNSWAVGTLQDEQDNSEEMLQILDANPQTYIDWATEYHEDSFAEDGISFATVRRIYDGEELTKEMVLSVVDDFEDWGQLKDDLLEINYPNNLK